jgi:hypothetical protein
MTASGLHIRITAREFGAASRASPCRSSRGLEGLCNTYCDRGMCRSCKEPTRDRQSAMECRFLSIQLNTARYRAHYEHIEMIAGYRRLAVTGLFHLDFVASRCLPKQQIALALSVHATISATLWSEKARKPSSILRTSHVACILTRRTPNPWKTNRRMRAHLGC